MKTGYLRRDESSHWYLIPKEEIEEFDNQMGLMELYELYSDEWYHQVDVFEETFGKYRTGGGISDLEVIIPDDN